MSGNNNAHTIQIPDRDKTPHNFPLIQPTDTDINLFLADLSSDDKMSTGNPTMESNLTFDAGSNNSFSTEEARQSTSKRFVNNIPSLDEIANYNNTRSTANRTFGSSILNSSYLDKDSIRKFESQIQSQNMFQPFDSPSPASQIPLPRQKLVKNNSYEIKLKNKKKSNNFTASEFLDLPALQTDFETKTITSTTQFVNPVVDSTTEDFSNINIKTNDTEFFDFLNNHDSALKTTEDFTSSINPDSFVSNTVPAINPNMIPDTINDMHEFIIPFDQPAPSLNGNQTIDLQTSGLHDLGRPEINIEYVDINPSNLTFLDRPVSSLSTDSTDYNNRFNTTSASHLLSPEHNNSTLLSPSSASPYDDAPHKQFSFDSVVSGMASPKTPGNANILRVPTNDEHNQMRIGRQHLRSRSRSGSRTGSRSRSGSNLSIRSSVSGFTDAITSNNMNLSPSKVPMTIKDDDSFYSDIENETDRDNHGGEDADEGSLLNCEFCEKKFSKPYSLKSHMKTHNDDKPYKCKICGKPFARTHDRKRHEDLHSGIKRFQCKGILPNGEFWGCEKRFARTDALRRHFYTESGKNCISPLLSGNMIRRDDDKDFEAESVAFAMENSIALMKKSSGDSKK